MAIYALIDAAGNARYVGKANDPEARLKSHIRDSRRRNTPVACWIRSTTPSMIVLDIVPANEWRAEERRWIASFRRWGVPLLNLAEGGDEPYQTPEQRAENGRRAARARVSTPIAKKAYEFRRRMGGLMADQARRGDFSGAYRTRFIAKCVATILPETCAWGASL